jgi:phage terminase large subunit-like protein
MTVAWAEAAARAWETATESPARLWRRIRRPNQVPPPWEDPWLVWLMLAGRGFGKSRTGAETVSELMRDLPGCRVALVAATFADARDTMVEGEALALDTILPTPTGYTTMGDLKPGDVILGGDGNPCTVTHAFPVLTGRPCYSIQVKGGVEIIADAQHRWLTEDYLTRAYTARHGLTRRMPRVVTTEEIRTTLRHFSGPASQANHGIRVTRAHLGRAGLPIDPYVLGAWLGDGTTKSAAITTADPEILDGCVRAGYPTHKQGRGNGSAANTYGIIGLQAQLRSTGLLRNKHVPNLYLRAGADQRLAILQGLMDTDGYVSERGQCEFVNKNLALAAAVVDLACGLGIKASAPRPKITRLGTTHWLVKFTTTMPVFRLQRKLARLPTRCLSGSHWYVGDVVPVESVPVRCIAVNSPDRTYLVTRHHIRTHNSGLLAVLDPAELRGGGIESAWNRSIGELFLANGSRATVYSSERPGRLRGPQHHVGWCDELAQWVDSWRDASEIQTTWSNLMLGLRLPARPGWPGTYSPRVIVTTTPKPCALLRVPETLLRTEPHRAGIMQLPADQVVITTGRTVENLENLADAFRKAVVEPLTGTRLGRQELDAELLTDVAGALLTQQILSRTAVLPGEVPRLSVTVTGVDPATTKKTTSDETGIITVGAAGEDLYVLEDRSGRYSPDEWARTAWTAALDHGSACIVVEDNAGGDMVETTLLTAWQLIAREYLMSGRPVPHRLPIVRVTPTGEGQGKWQRAQPVALLFDQGRAHMVRDPDDPRGLAQLEDQATSWTGRAGEKSPDRVDAMVHATTWIMFPAVRAGATAQGRPARRGSVVRAR